MKTTEKKVNESQAFSLQVKISARGILHKIRGIDSKMAIVIFKLTNKDENIVLK